MRARYWTTVILGGFAVYSAIAVLGGISAVVYFSRAHVPVDWNAYVANRFLEQYTCALFVAPLFWLVDRFPLIGASWRRHALVLVAAILCFIVV
jgi:hypothetical protein